MIAYLPGILISHFFQHKLQKADISNFQKKL